MTVQSFDALARANQVRLKHAEFRTTLLPLSYSEGLCRVAELLEEPVEGPLASLSVGKALRRVNRVGASLADLMLRSSGIWSSDRKLGALTDRQREALRFECELRAMRSGDQSQLRKGALR